jgi:hypothetical protein
MIAFLSGPVLIAVVLAIVLRRRISRRVARTCGIVAGVSLVAAMASTVLFDRGLVPQAVSDPFDMLLVVTLFLLVGLCSLPFYVIPARTLNKSRST